MDIGKLRRCGVGRTGLVAILAGLVGACADQSGPAPVFQKGDMAPIVAPMPAPPPALQVIVRRGQTLDGYAYTYHVPKSAIIAANGLHPPYQLKAGQHLTIPAFRSIPPGAPLHQASARPVAPPPIAAAPLTPPSAPHAETPSPPPAAVPQSLTPPLTPPLTPSGSSPAKASPDVIPLDGPPPPKQAAAAPPPAALTPPPPEAAHPPPPSAPETAAAQPTASGRFPWPVRGRVLANYGNTPGGGHNDGINIAAPRGTPVRAIDSGTVVYAGNEVKGYGNIVLIKHSNGWISAYAHLDDVTAKPGDAIAAGQVIAKVGESGGVAEPQLHFELRRGKRPVDPKEFLAPSPSAAGPAGNKPG
ncbi:MAG TPA: peptidoglycan DD-metalloendopeptidase family protein [Stellaceae bacterium]|nr:peptidoglycan DD-metalloendopeptidase family protein [Stellaceae bacterium]